MRDQSLLWSTRLVTRTRLLSAKQQQNLAAGMRSEEESLIKTISKLFTVLLKLFTVLDPLEHRWFNQSKFGAWVGRFYDVNSLNEIFYRICLNWSEPFPHPQTAIQVDLFRPVRNL